MIGAGGGVYCSAEWIKSHGCTCWPGWTLSYGPRVVDWVIQNGLILEMLLYPIVDAFNTISVAPWFLFIGNDIKLYNHAVRLQHETYVHWGDHIFGRFYLVHI